MRNFLTGLLGLLITMTAGAQQVAKGLTAKNGQYIGFLEYTPTDYASNPTTKYPVIIFLHGFGERGDGKTTLGSLLLGGTPPKLIQDGNPMRFFWNGKWETFIVLSPQLNSQYTYWQNWYVDEMLDYATKNLRIDPDRIFLTGLSMGGGGTWAYAGASLENAKKFAAIGISCGACTNTNWGNIANANLPTWAFHAADDNSAAPVTCTIGAITEINRYNPAVKPYYTQWPSGGHWIWGRVYDPGYSFQNPNLYEWFLGQNKSLAPNVRPVANAGSNQTIPTGGTLTLNASGSRDQDGNIVRYVWTKTSGPSFGTISTPVSENGITTVTGLTQAGTYTFEVKVIDNRADWTFATVTITVKDGTTPEKPTNTLPVANAGADAIITLPANSVTLNGAASSDADGSLTGWSWTKVSGPAQGTIANAAAASTEVTGLAEGTYTFRLKVTDNGSGTATDDMVVTVKPAADKPLEVIVNAGVDISLTLPANSTTLNGSGSSETNGSIKQYEWTKISGPSQFTIANPAAASTALTNLAQGVYNFQLTVWGSDWVPRTDIVVVTVNQAPPTNPPQVVVANAGADITITLPVNNATLNGSASADPLGIIKEYKWRRISGPSQPSFANVAAAITGVSNLVEGVYNFELMVWGNNWVPRADTVKVTVKAGTPTNPSQVVVANAGADMTITLPVNNVTLNGSASADPLGIIKEYKWRRLSGPSQPTIANVAAAITGVSNLVEGVYSFELMVWGNNWVPRADTVNVTVKAGAPNPDQFVVANAGPDVTITLPVNNTTLNGSASTDPLGIIKQYEWAKISGPASFNIVNSGAAVSALSNLTEGVYSFRLTVWGNNWVPRADTVNVTVRPGPASGPQPSIANAGADILLTYPANSTTLNGSASADPAGVIKDYQWNKINGPAQYSIASPKAAVTALTNLVPGVYTFRLTVWGNNWVPVSDTVAVVVRSTSSGQPGGLANAGPDIAITLPDNATVLNGSASVDPLGIIKDYKWSRISGPSQAVIANPKAAITGISNLEEGVYSFELMVWGNNWVPRADTVLVIVSAVNSATTLSSINTAPVIMKESIDIKGTLVAEKLQLYPNPARDMINIQCSSATNGASSIFLYDAAGKLIRKVGFQKSQALHQQTMAVNSLTPGVYHIEIVINNSTRLTSRFLKQ